jgi:hypothetical protein
VKVQGLAATCPSCGNLVTVAPVAGEPAAAPFDPPLAQIYAPEPVIPQQAIPAPPPPSPRRATRAPAKETHPGWYVLWAALTVIGLLITIDWMRLRFFASAPAPVATAVTPTPPPRSSKH